MTRLIYLGAEVPSNRTLLETTSANYVGVSYWRLTKRGLPKKSSYLLENYFNPDFLIHVHPGIPKETTLDRVELETFAAEYEGFIADNIDRLETFNDINAEWIDPAFVQEQRNTVWSEVPPSKFQPVWSPIEDLKTLTDMAGTYLDIAIPGGALEENPQLSVVMRTHIRNGTRFHILGSARPDSLRQLAVETISTQAWLSPMLHGETIVWDGTKLNRYPKRMKDQARSRYRHIYQKAGVDADKIFEDDPQEVCRLAVWSYTQFETRMNAMNHNSDDELLYNNSGETDVDINAENTPSVYDNKGIQPRKLEARNPDEMGNLPVFGVQYKEVVETENGVDTIREVPLLNSQSVSLRACDTCFVADKCPAFKPQTACAFKLPVEIKTKDQLKALLNSIIEMQGQRIAFMRFAEEMSGGYADPNLSQEIDRLYKIVGEVNKLSESKEYIRITAERSGSAGVLSSIFGDRAQALRELPNNGLNEEQTTKIIRQSLEDK
jgi:hypothetical protein